MATALVRGLATAEGFDPGQVGVTDIDPTRADALARAHGVCALADARALAGWADVIVLAVKPQGAVGVLSDLAPALTARHLVISIAAGVTTAQLAAPLPDSVRVVRVMSNTPALVGAGATAVCAGPRATPDDLALVEELCGAVGRVVQVQETAMNAVTGLSGSGPAYIFVAIEALADAGVREGLSRDVAQQLAAQTVLGAAKLVLEGGEHPGQLKDRVTSPAGTTIAGIASLEADGFRSALIRAVRAAVARADELAG